MALGSRITKQARRAVAASLVPTPRQPLLFLYPSWIRNSSTSKAVPLAHDGSRLITGPSPPEDIATPSSGSLFDDVRELEQQAKEKDKAQVVPTTDCTSNTSRNHKQGAIKTNNALRKNTLQAMRELRPLSDAEWANPHMRAAWNMMRKVLTLREKLDFSRKNRLENRSTAHQTRRRSDTPLPDWREILSCLIINTPDHGKPLAKSAEFSIPANQVGPLLSGIDDFIVDIGRRHGCLVSLSDRVGSWHNFIVSGSAIALIRTAADVIRIAPDLAIKVASRHAQGDTRHGNREERVALKGNIPLRYVISEARTRPRVCPPENIPRPRKWTDTSFLNYVRALTEADATNHQHLYFRQQRSYPHSVAEIVKELYSDPQLRFVISRTACHELMDYFIKKSVTLIHAREIFVYMEKYDLRPVPETFNIMLRGAAKVADLHNFRFILDLMVRRGVVPNAETWMAFMICHNDTNIQSLVVSHMSKKGLLHDQKVVKGIAEQLAKSDIEASLSSSQSHEQFIAHMDSRYGPTWLSLETGNRIIHVLAARALISRGCDFVQFMQSRFIQPDKRTLNTIIHQCQQTSNMSGAIAVLKTIAIQPDEKVFHSLFELAWSLRSYNVVRMVWKYACLYASTSYRMRERVFASMSSDLDSTSVQNPSERWKEFAGRFILHDGANKQPVLTTGIHLKNVLQEHLRPSRADVTVKMGVEKATVVPGHWEEQGRRLLVSQKTAIKVQVGRDSRMYQYWEPVHPIWTGLEEAMQRDLSWKENGYHRPGKKDDAWLMENSVCVLIHPKGGLSSGVEQRW